jgi:hypothetical protein
MDRTSAQWRFREGDTVFGADGHKLGKIVGFFPDYTDQQFLIVEKGRILTHDYYVPIGAVSNYEGNEVFLDVGKDDVVNRGWDQTPMPASTDTGLSAG